jgi:hypothetical protein
VAAFGASLAAEKEKEIIFYGLLLKEQVKQAT